ncbi:uncharacterized protein FIBRA_07194 [Fibroporia radiculosa]|uniref:UDENN domain-containing protein n=1 Tax=Fibroporia radiculosa TaxID=599839 RepID=J4IBP0_9APHY|nr:uncharacterized protein FIBRA_07194 [Fibroporia radiculosa]CCM04996.1 predicted protein [Fibroporia radiculosa]
MAEDAEDDIGLSLLSNSSKNSPGRPGPPARTISNGLRSPSSPNLLPISPRRLTRSNTTPRKHSYAVHQPSLSLDGLFMEPAKIAKLRRWISGIVIVDFDLELGPKVSCTYPPLDLSPSEAENIAFSSFPDSPQFDQGSQVHSFRIRVHSSAEDKLLRPSSQRPISEDGYIYGFSHFTQRRDAASKRGYQQRSVVILTHLAYPAFFYTLLNKLGPAFLSHGGPMLEAACHNIANWSDPSSGAVLELGFLGAVFFTELPLNADTQQALQNASSRRKDGSYDPQYHILASLPPPDPPVLCLFEACLPQLWSIWECLVLCEPILVYGPSPAMTSQAIWWLRDILRPIPQAGDFRTFFTIHDADCSALVNSRPPGTGLILGVTNPVFERSCKHWPHVLSLGRSPPAKADMSMIAGPAPGWKTRTHSRYTSRDRSVLQTLQEACTGSEQAKREASALLRQHFSSRTAAFLVPLQRYLQRLIPLPSSSASTNFPSTPYPRSSTSGAFPPTPLPKSSNSALFPSTPFLRTSASTVFPKSAVSFTFPKSISSITVSTPLSVADSKDALWKSASPSIPAESSGSKAKVASGLGSGSRPPRLDIDSSDGSQEERPSTPDSSVLASTPSATTQASTPTSTLPRLAPFSERAFLASLKSASGPLALPFKSTGKARDFYARWIRTPGFGLWIARQEEAVDRVLGRT